MLAQAICALMAHLWRMIPDGSYLQMRSDEIGFGKFDDEIDSGRLGYCLSVWPKGYDKRWYTRTVATSKSWLFFRPHKSGLFPDEPDLAVWEEEFFATHPEYGKEKASYGHIVKGQHLQYKGQYFPHVQYGRWYACMWCWRWEDIWYSRSEDDSNWLPEWLLPQTASDAGFFSDCLNGCHLPCPASKWMDEPEGMLGLCAVPGIGFLCGRCRTLEEPPWWPNNRNRCAGLLARGQRLPPMLQINPVTDIIAKFLVLNTA